VRAIAFLLDVRSTASGSHQFMTINLHAVTDFEKGDTGRVTGHKVVKVDHSAVTDGLVVALQSVKAGSNGWFERNRARVGDEGATRRPQTGGRSDE
jgi:hypothetical protein